MKTCSDAGQAPNDPKLGSFGAVDGRLLWAANPKFFGVCVVCAPRGNWVRLVKFVAHAPLGNWVRLAKFVDHWPPRRWLMGGNAGPWRSRTSRPPRSRISSARKFPNAPKLGSFGAIRGRMPRAANLFVLGVCIAQAQLEDWVRSAKIARFAARRSFQIGKERAEARPSRFIRSAGDGSVFHEFGNSLGNFRGSRSGGAKPGVERPSRAPRGPSRSSSDAHNGILR